MDILEIQSLIAQSLVASPDRQKVLSSIMAAIREHVEAERDDAYQDGSTEGYANAERDFEKREDAAFDQDDNIRIALSLIDSDRPSARVYLERPTGKHVFNIGEQQACLL